MRQVISRMSLINGHLRCGTNRGTFALFRKMKMLVVNDVMPNKFTMAALFSGRERLVAREHGKWDICLY